MLINRFCKISKFRLVNFGFRSLTNSKTADDIRQEILEKSIEFIPECGFTKDSIVKAAKSLNYPVQLHGIINNGSYDLIYYFYETRNGYMANYLTDLKTQYQNEKKDLNTRIIIEEGVKFRLGCLKPVIKKWPDAMLQLAHPMNVCKSLWLFRNLLDEIWIQAGDKSNSLSWYTKRASLAGAYKSTELFMLQDTSEDYEATWKFLKNRLDEAEFVGHLGMNVGQFINGNLKNFPVTSGVFDLMKNVAGVRRNQ